MHADNTGAAREWTATSACHCFVGNCQASRCLPLLCICGAGTKTQVRVQALFAAEALGGLSSFD